MLTKLQRQLFDTIATMDRPTRAQLSMQLGWTYHALQHRLHRLWHLGYTNLPLSPGQRIALTAHGTFTWLCSIKRSCQLQDFVRIQAP